MDLLIKWWDEDFIRSFLANRWVVIVSINEFKEDNPESFWNIVILLEYNWAEVQMLMQWEDLSASMSFIVTLWLRPLSMNFIDNPISEEQVKTMLDSTVLAAEEEDKKIKQQEEFEELKEKKKYEESWIKDWLKIINLNIDRIEQVLKAGKWVLSSNEIKELENYLSEMKKIRLWTNFNKMTALVLDSHVLLERAEKQIFDANEENKFLIDENSCVTNIDVLREYSNSSRTSEKATLQPAWLSVSESITNVIWTKSVFLKLLNRDIAHSFDGYSFDEFFDIVVNLLEFIVLLVIIVISMSWVIGSLLWFNNFSLYLLTAMWWLWLLIYLLNNIELKGVMPKILWFLALALVYWRGLKLLLNTFAL